MNLKRNKISLSVMLALSSTVLMPNYAMAQEEGAEAVDLGARARRPSGPQIGASDPLGGRRGCQNVKISRF